VGQLYVHLPFCETICTFCPIHKQRLPSEVAVQVYIDAVCRELDALSRTPFVRSLEFTSVYFGGGTPSLLPDQHLGVLIGLIRDRFTLIHPQITFEGHVRSLTRQKLRFARALGFNRLSTGIQTFDASLRRALNLTPSRAEINTCIATAREEGFNDINIDLMYNLPGQTPDIWECDLRSAVALAPTGIDAYEAVIAASTPLYKQVHDGTLRLETRPRVLARNYELAEQLLAASGYVQRNLFAWDRPGFENIILGHSQRLKEGTSQIVGAGMSAYSHVNGMSFMNRVDRPSYVRQVHAEALGVGTASDASPQLAKERFAIMSLHDLYLDNAAYGNQFGSTLEGDFPRQLSSFQSRGLVQREERGFALTPLGRAWATTMGIEFYGPAIIAKLLRLRIEGRLSIPMTYEEEYLLPVFSLFHPDLTLRDGAASALSRELVSFHRRRNRQWLGRTARLAVEAALGYGLRVRPREHLSLLRGLLVRPAARVM
jgi:oxygen-independent coproporphyrinogen-3 oxidase